MSEEIKKNEVPVENPAPEETEMPAAQEAVALQVAVPTAVTMWKFPHGADAQLQRTGPRSVPQFP